MLISSGQSTRERHSKQQQQQWPATPWGLQTPPCISLAPGVAGGEGWQAPAPPACPIGQGRAEEVGGRGGAQRSAYVRFSYVMLVFFFFASLCVNFYKKHQIPKSLCRTLFYVLYSQTSQCLKFSKKKVCHPTAGTFHSDHGFLKLVCSSQTPAHPQRASPIVHVGN